MFACTLVNREVSLCFTSSTAPWALCFRLPVCPRAPLPSPSISIPLRSLKIFIVNTSTPAPTSSPQIRSAPLRSSSSISISTVGSTRSIGRRLRLLVALSTVAQLKSPPISVRRGASLSPSAICPSTTLTIISMLKLERWRRRRPIISFSKRSSTCRKFERQSSHAKRRLRRSRSSLKCRSKPTAEPSQALRPKSRRSLCQNSEPRSSASIAHSVPKILSASSRR